MSALAPNSPFDEAIVRLNKRVRRLTVTLIVVSIFLIAGTVASAILGWRKMNAIEKTQDDIQFNQFVSDFNSGNDYVLPQVNSIQFLRRGYSITFDSVQYTQDGLVLTGKLGNATNLWISSLALDMTARPFPYTIKDKWLRGKIFWWAEAWDIRHAQTTVGILNPGSTALFSTTIPNVRQTPDGFQIAVSFSGERYQYLGK